MRILKVRFRNLNSLIGEWEVDFTHPSYIIDGIFAITGPTGAGKSTLLDAICLALYGQTPRLDKVTKTSNDIMTRRTGDCFAEVSFETQIGGFRCHWSQRRSRGKPDGELQQPRHEIAELDTGKVLESKLRDVAEVIERVTGMDFGRFTRSMLLAQGGFAAFLKASPDERAPLLEQITGTEIYSQISIAVHERRSCEEGKLQALEAGVQGISLPTDEEERCLHHEIVTKEDTLHDTTERLECLHGMRIWLETIARVEEELTQLDNRLAEAQGWIRDFESERLLLEADKRAQGISAQNRSLCETRNRAHFALRQLEDARAQLPRNERTCEESRSRLHEALKASAEAELELQRELRVASEIRVLDSRIEEKRKIAADASASRVCLQKEHERISESLHRADSLLQESIIRRNEIERQCSLRSADAQLVSELAGIRKSMSVLSECLDHRVRLEEQLAIAQRGAHAARERERSTGIARDRTQSLCKDIQLNCLQLTQELEVILEGRQIAQWRDEWESLEHRVRAETGALTLREQIIQMEGALFSQQETLVSTQRSLHDISEQVQQVTQSHSRLFQEVEYREREVTLRTRIRDLEQLRNTLSDGDPCPLCGSCNHPYAKVGSPQLDEAEKALRSAREAERREHDLLTDLTIRSESLGKDCRQLRESVDAMTRTLEQERNVYREMIAGLIVGCPEEDSEAALRGDLEMLNSRVSHCEDVIHRAQEVEARLRVALDRSAQAQKQLADCDREWQEACFRHQHAMNDVSRLTTEKQHLAKRRASSEQIVLQEIGPYGFGSEDMADLDKLGTTLEERCRQWKGLQVESDRLRSECIAHESEKTTQSALLERAAEDLRNAVNLHQRLSIELESLLHERQGLYGTKHPDAEVRRCHNAVESAKILLQERRDALLQQERIRDDCLTRVDHLGSALVDLDKEVVSREEEFLHSCLQSGFPDEQSYARALLPVDQREILQNRFEELKTLSTEIKAGKSLVERKLAAERARSLTDQTREQVEQELSDLKVLVDRAQQELGGLRLRLEQNEMMRAQRAQYAGSIERQKVECSRWGNLHALIGSADGKKFRNLAQGLTFDRVIGHANSQLRKMTDRYLLIRDPASPLELNVIDHYQAGESRSTRNLSGGESFLVSLSLALGLSAMASSRVRVDSLFIDEGFGVLDNEALDTALDTLASLRQEGKLIGVISHVNALKERIGTQIQVVPLAGGRSQLKGPGCSGNWA